MRILKSKICLFARFIYLCERKWIGSETYLVPFYPGRGARATGGGALRSAAHSPRRALVPSRLPPVRSIPLFFPFRDASFQFSFSS